MLRKRSNVETNVLDARYILSKAKQLIQTQEQLRDLDELLLSVEEEENQTPYIKGEVAKGEVAVTAAVKAILETYRYTTGFWYTYENEIAMYVDTRIAKELPVLSTEERDKVRSIYKEIFGEVDEAKYGYILNVVIPLTVGAIFKDIALDLASRYSKDFCDFLVNIKYNQIGNLIITTVPVREFRGVYALRPIFHREKFAVVNNQGDVCCFVDDEDPEYWN